MRKNMVKAFAEVLWANGIPKEQWVADIERELRSIDAQFKRWAESCEKAQAQDADLPEPGEVA
jgi:hypothetical protein